MKQSKGSWSGWVAILILIALLVLVTFFTGPLRSLTNDIIGGGLFSLFVAALIASFFFVLTLWLTGPHVLPINLRDSHEKAAARRTLQRFAFGSPTLTAVVREAKVEPGPNDENREPLSGAGALDVDSTSVVVLVTDTGLSRIHGQGVLFTSEDEKIGQAIDLRIQIRTDVFDFTTRDGIPIKTRVTIRFQIDHVRAISVQTAHKAQYLRPYSWTPQTERAVKSALSLQSVTAEGQTKWDDIPLRLTVGLLRTIVAGYTFDQLTEPLEPRKDPRSEIKTQLGNSVKEALAPKGINVLTVGVGIFFPARFDQKDAFEPNFKPADQLDPITQQRVKAWQAEWHSRMIKVSAEGQAEADRRLHLARAQAQMELITRVTQALEQGAPVATDTQDQIARRFLDTLQKLAAHSYLRPWQSEDERVRVVLDTGEPGEIPATSESYDQTVQGESSSGPE